MKKLNIFREINIMNLVTHATNITFSFYYLNKIFEIERVNTNTLDFHFSGTYFRL